MAAAQEPFLSARHVGILQVRRHPPLGMLRIALAASSDVLRAALRLPGVYLPLVGRHGAGSGLSLGLFGGEDYDSYMHSRPARMLVGRVGGWMGGELSVCSLMAAGPRWSGCSGSGGGCGPPGPAAGPWW